MTKCALSLSLILLVQTAAQSQDRLCQTRNVPVNIFSHNQSLKLALSPSDLEASSGKQTLNIAEIIPRTESHKIVMLSDVSGSMLDAKGGRTAASWYFQWELSADFISAVSSQHDVGLAIFANEMRPLVWPTRDRAALMDQIQSVGLLQTNALSGLDRKTALWDAIGDTISKFGPFTAGDAIYVISDGEDNDSRTAPVFVKEALLDAGVRLFAFRFHVSGARLDRYDNAPGGLTGLIGKPYWSPTLLQSVAAETGGWATTVERPIGSVAPRSLLLTRFAGPSQLRRTLDFLYGLMGGFYTVRVELPAPRLRAAPLNLSFRGGNNERQRELTITYPHALTPCSGN